MRRLAQCHRAAGFRSLKLRVGVGALDRDRARPAWLCERFGAGLKLAIDANGAWCASTAAAAISRLEALGLAYVGQPTPPSDLDALETVAGATDGPVMIDEGLQDGRDLDQPCGNAPRIWAHLKIEGGRGGRDGRDRPPA